MSTARLVSVGSVRLAVTEDGPRNGPTILLLHGFPESARAWRQIAPVLAARGCRVVAPDLRGYGRSDAPPGVAPYAIDRLVGDIVGLIEAIGADDLVLTGHDWGGVIAWAVAARHPGRMRRLVILNAPHPDTMAVAMRRDPRQALRSAYVAFFQLPWLPERMLSASHHRMLRRSLVATSRPGTFGGGDLDAYEREWSAPGRLTAMLAYYRALRLRRSRLGRIAVPTTLLWGMRDRFLGPSLIEAAAERCDHVRMVRFEDATHWLHHEEPLRVADEIEREVRA